MKDKPFNHASLPRKQYLAHAKARMYGMQYHYKIIQLLTAKEN